MARTWRRGCKWVVSGVVSGLCKWEVEVWLACVKGCGMMYRPDPPATWNQRSLHSTAKVAVFYPSPGDAVNESGGDGNCSAW